MILAACLALMAIAVGYLWWLTRRQHRLTRQRHPAIRSTQPQATAADQPDA